MKPFLNDAQAALLRAVHAIIVTDALLCDLVGGEHRQTPLVVVEQATSTDWASVTFSGQQHRIEFRIDCAVAPSAAAIARLDTVLSQSEIELAHYIVAEIAVVGARLVSPGDGAGLTAGGDGMHRLALVVEALTLED